MSCQLLHFLWMKQCPAPNFHVFFGNESHSCPGRKCLSIGGLPRTAVRCAVLSHAGAKFADRGGASTLGSSADVVFHEGYPWRIAKRKAFVSDKS